MLAWRQSTDPETEAAIDAAIRASGCSLGTQEGARLVVLDARDGRTNVEEHRALGAWVAVIVDSKTVDDLLDGADAVIEAPADTEAIRRSLVIGKRQVEERANELISMALPALLPVVDSVPLLIAYIDQQRVFRWLNAHGKELLGPEAAGKAVSEVLGKSQFDRSAPFFDRLLDGKSTAGRLRLVLNDRLIHLSVTGVPCEEEGMKGAFLIAEDPSRMDHETEERVERATRELRAQKLESLGILAGGIAHDFNNLLSGLLGNASFLLEDLPPSPTRDAVLDIERAARRATDLTRQLLAYSGRGRFDISRARVNDVVQEMNSLLLTAVGGRGTLAFELDAEDPGMVADLTQVRQVLMNLVTNAADAMDRETESAGSIVVATGTADIEGSERGLLPGPRGLAGRYTWIEVRDTGPGLDAGIQQRIFDPFFSTRSAGRGLGLSAVQGIVYGHGGAIEVESAPNAGTRIRVYFPHDAATTKPTESSGDLSGALGGVVLVVDDEAMVRRYLSRVLEPMGFRVLQASDGVQGVELFAQHHESLSFAIVDLVMPRLDGNAVLAQMRAINPRVKVLMSSGYSETDVVKADAFLPKPTTPELLREKVRELLSSDS